MDRESYSRIARLYADSTYRAALSVCGNKPDAEDAVQSAFLKLLKTEADFESGEHIRKWLVRVAVNECKSVWRSFWKRNTVSLDDLDKELVYTESDSREVFAEVMKLPKNYRSVIYLYYYEGYSCDEIAGLLGITPSNVQTRLARARSKLKEQLGEAWL